MTGTAIETRRSAAIDEWGQDFRDLVLDTVLRPRNRRATMAELALLAEQAVRTGLDPMARQIYGIYRKNRSGQEEMTIQVAIDGFRTVAQRTGQYAGGPAPLFTGPDGDWRELWLAAEPPVAAKVAVRKVVNGVIVDSEAIALWSEYAAMYNGKPQNLWASKPCVMLAKCAEALALRKAFPQDLSGLYTDDEMAQAGPVSGQPVAVAQAPQTPQAQPEPVEAQVVEEPITADEVERLVGLIFDFDLDPKAVHNAVAWVADGEVGSCDTPEEASAALAVLTPSQARRLDEWIDKKAGASSPRGEGA